MSVHGLECNKCLYVLIQGALGKRTRFQQKYLAQLILEVKRMQDQPDQTDTEASPVPTPLTMLPKVGTPFVLLSNLVFFDDRLLTVVYPVTLFTETLLFAEQWQYQ